MKPITDAVASVLSQAQKELNRVRQAIEMEGDNEFVIIAPAIEADGVVWKALQANGAFNVWNLQSQERMEATVVQLKPAQ